MLRRRLNDPGVVVINRGFVLPGRRVIELSERDAKIWRRHA